MFGSPFGHNTLRKYVIYFGTLFNNIYLNRYNADGLTLIQTSKVPLNYGPRDKFLARLDGNPDLNRKIAIQLPRMTYEMTGLYYDPSRRMSVINKVSVAEAPNNKVSQYTPVPYNIDFTLSILVKNVMDGTYIVEQILPYFGPTWQATLNLNPDLNLTYDVPITLDSVTQEDTYEGGFTERRAIIWTLNFTMKGWLFGPTSSTDSGIIRDINVNFNTNNFGSNTQPSELLRITPGQDSNGNVISLPPKLYSYGITAANSAFYVTEKLESISNTSNYAYIRTANSSYITAYNVGGTLNVGSRVRGSVTGLTANITSISTKPVPQLPDDVNESLNYGFIIDIMENDP
jgi:hypothetical protein